MVVRLRGFHILSRQSFTDGGEVVSLTRWPPYTPPGRFLVLISVRGRVYPRVIVQLEELGKLKTPTSLGLNPTTFRLVTQCLNQLCYRMPHGISITQEIQDTAVSRARSWQVCFCIQKD
jgi:hypothetical protein